MVEKKKDETLGSFIARLRKEKGYSQRKLALVSGVSNTTINRIENGSTPNPDLTTLKALAAALGVEETDLLNACGYLNNEELSDDGILTPKDLKHIEKDLEKMMEMLQSNPRDGYSAYGGDTNISEEGLDLFEDALRTAFKIIKKLNKETYTPKIYKNKKG